MFEPGCSGESLGKMAEKRTFIHADKFRDGTKCLEVYANGEVFIIDYSGARIKADLYSLEYCEAQVKLGNWLEEKED